MIKGSQIRSNFVDFFKSKGHVFVPSSPVVPKDDPTLLFTNAGMNQFKPIFLGKEKREYTRVANYQKCIRVSGKHNDLEEVGKDGRHHTFFEMLGNWSFGDYYKKEAIEFAWEYLTEVLKLPKEKLYVTVYEDDNEAEELWKTVTDVDHSHISRWGMKENFWEMGDTGPCGPCSEIHYDRGEKYSSVDDPNCGVNCDGERFWEIWNLVFIQYNRLPDGSLEELPSKHVDTGMGLERLTAILQGKDSNYETDLFWPLIEHLEELTGKQYSPDNSGMPFRVIADHIRAISFAIADGALPSNEGRGYVIRRLLRRAARYGYNIDMKEPFIYKLVPTLVDFMGDAYPELKEQHDHISLVIKSEEERFFKTLGQGITIFNKIVEKEKETKMVSGKDAFLLYDTYGFPIDLTRVMAEEIGFNIDLKNFEILLEKQREQSRNAASFDYDVHKNWVEFTQGEHSIFKGYETSELVTQIRKYYMEDDKIEIILHETPFYAESGGQVADHGYIEGENFEIQVYNVQKTFDGIVHYGKLNGTINNPNVKAIVDTNRLKSISRHHTATHLLQAALRKLLGEHVHQSGSLVCDDYLRFDFTHFQALNEEELRDIENEVNDYIMANYPVKIEFMDINEAKKAGAMALFGEKYDKIVRVVKIEPVSMELCGGIHCKATGEIGLFKIVSETGIAAGIRRIVAKAGMPAIEYVNNFENIIKNLSGIFATKPENLTNIIDQKLKENHELLKKLEKLQSEKNKGNLETLLNNKEVINGINVIIAQIDVDNIELLRKAADFLKNKLKNNFVIILSSIINNKVNFIVSISQELTEKYKNLHAGKLIKEIAKVCGGGGGGKPYFAQAGGKDTSKIPEALDFAKELIKKFS